MFVQNRETNINYVPFRLLVLSRRAWMRQGTRLTCRGADADGNVANFVETEQIVIQKDGSLSSYVQIRGSIPLHWQQLPTLKYAPKITFTAAANQNAATLEKHLRKQMGVYGEVVMVNLIDKKKQELALGTAYGEAVQKMNETRVRYVWFDFHHECRKMKYENLSKLMNDVSAEFDRHSFFARDANGKVLSVQRGVFRTNCVDNLDRTNVVQSLFARKSALVQFSKTSDSVLSSPFRDFEKSFKNLWADHADIISSHYSGTGALKTDFTRTGKRTILGAVNDGYNSATRFYLNNLCDGQRQDGIDLLLGKYAVEPKELSAYAKSKTVFGPHATNAWLKLLYVLMIFVFVLLTLNKVHTRKLVNKPRLLAEEWQRPVVKEDLVLSEEGITLLRESAKEIKKH
jgi:hypothetical protein